ncbi:hypothetical protein PVAP13_2NG188200 [Panicum virgatum]|uniref:Uncharacterized protein n=1 Tax=Panicum virgatum TaxID=38727 RepID=A0A8T0VCU9_PANVG|nr:hypothetical protein PVAP13_2NG188200 [Panicum virgatum]
MAMSPTMSVLPTKASNCCNCVGVAAGATLKATASPKKIFTAVFRGAYWLRFWSLLQREDTRKTVCLASKALEVVALDIFAKNGWRSNNRLCF